MSYSKETLHELISILKSISKTYGVQTYIVGGAVRDILALHQPKDIDVVTTGDPKQIANILSKRYQNATARQVPAPFVLWKVSSDEFAIDIVKLDGGIEEDSKDRNFTINAVYYDVSTDKFQDPSDSGFKDIHSKTIRAMAGDCFKKRGDNIFIAMRLVSELGMKIESRTLHMMAQAVKAEGADRQITKRGQEEIRRTKIGLFYPKTRNILRFLGLAEFYETYSPLSSTGEREDIRTIIAKYKSKKQTEKGNTIYEYGDKDKAKRAEKKARHVRTVFKNIKKLVSTFEKDLGSEDMATRMCALAVALIYHTYERVGDRTNIGTGVTSLKKKHVTVSGGTVKFKYVGKSHVKQDKEVKDARVVKVIKELLKDKADNGYLFDFEGDERVDIGAKDVNAYLKQFGITAKDLRGHAANDLIMDRLKKAPKPPKGATEAERTKFLKEKLKECIEDVAEEIGHTPGICKSSYIDPKIISDYEESGKVSKLAWAYQDITKVGGDKELEAYLMKMIPNSSEDSVGNEMSALKARIDSPDAEVDQDVSNVAEVMQAIDKLKSVSPEALKGILKIRHSSKSETPAPESAFAFVVSHEPFIVYIDTEKIKSAVQSGQDVTSALRHPELVAQIAGVIGHEGEHAKGDTGEDKPNKRQDEITKRIMLETSSQDELRIVIATAEDDDDIFKTLGIKISKDTAIQSSRAVVEHLKLGSGDRAVVNTALLAMGYLIQQGENPYRVEWNIRKALNIENNISFAAAKDLYQILSRNIIRSVDDDGSGSQRLSLFADPTGELANMGDSVSPRWEAEPSTVPNEWKAFFPQKHPVNF